MWVHESFANYAEALYTECQDGQGGRRASTSIGARANIRNDAPIVGAVRRERRRLGRHVLQGRQHAAHHPPDRRTTTRSGARILRGLNADVLAPDRDRRSRSQDYISAHAGMDLSKVFEQYLTTTKIPSLEYRLDGTTLSYRWADVVPGFDMPVGVVVGPEQAMRLTPDRAMADDDAARSSAPTPSAWTRTSSSTPAGWSGRGWRRRPPGRAGDRTGRAGPVAAADRRRGRGRLAAVRLPRAEPDRRGGARATRSSAAGGCTC